MASRTVRSTDKAGPCLSKHRHETKGEALGHLARTRQMDKSGVKRSREMHVYQCGFCQGWHIGHPIGIKARHHAKDWVTRPKRGERVMGDEC